jgi:hypothetical protein
VLAWRQGEIGWDAIDAGVVLDGPAGTDRFRTGYFHFLENARSGHFYW